MIQNWRPETTKNNGLYWIKNSFILYSVSSKSKSSELIRERSILAIRVLQNSGRSRNQSKCSFSSWTRLPIKLQYTPRACNTRQEHNLQIVLRSDTDAKIKLSALVTQTSFVFVAPQERSSQTPYIQRRLIYFITREKNKAKVYFAWRQTE